MVDRRLILRVMLWSLGLAAAAGVLAVLAWTGTLAWRVVGTGIATAVACALMLPASALVDRESSRPAGLLGMAGTILEFLLVVVVIWELPWHLFGVRHEERQLATIVLLGIAVLVLMALLMLRNRPVGAIAARTGIVVALATMAAYLLGIWWPHDWASSDEQWMESGTAILLFGGLASLALAGLGTGDRRHWRWLGVATAVAACYMWVDHAWTGRSSDIGFVIFCTCACIASVVGHAMFCALNELKPEQVWVRTVTVATAVLTAALIDVLVIDERLYSIVDSTDFIERITAAGGIVTGCGTLAILVLARLNRRPDLESVSTDARDMTVVCPRCNKKQSINLGASACAACGLRISIRVEDPRCLNCDYLLYGLASDRCPECGTSLQDITAS